MTAMIRSPGCQTRYVFQNNELGFVGFYWTDEKPEPELTGTQRLDLAKNFIASRKYKDAARQIVLAWNHDPERDQKGPDNINVSSLDQKHYQLQKQERDLLIQADRGMKKQEIVDYLAVAPVSVIDRDVSGVANSQFTDLPTLSEYKARVWKVVYRPDFEYRISCDVENNLPPFDHTIVGVEIVIGNNSPRYEQIAALVGKPKPKGSLPFAEKRIQPPSAELTELLDREYFSWYCPHPQSY
jgi:hypothetical protein